MIKIWNITSDKKILLKPKKKEQAYELLYKHDMYSNFIKYLKRGSSGISCFFYTHKINVS